MGAGLPEPACRRWFQTTFELLRLNAVVVSVKGKGIAKPGLLIFRLAERGFQKGRNSLIL